jgi:hypothetical protein
MGSIEAVAVNGDSTTLTILGQVFETSTEESLGFVAGDYVVAAVHSSYGTTVYSVGTPYVAGISTVRIKAPVTAIDVRLGKASFGSTTVDYTGILSGNPSTAPEVGKAFEVVGTQPVAQGLVLAGPGESTAVGCPALDGRM